MLEIFFLIITKYVSIYTTFPLIGLFYTFAIGSAQLMLQIVTTRLEDVAHRTRSGAGNMLRQHANAGVTFIISTLLCDGTTVELLQCTASIQISNGL